MSKQVIKERILELKKASGTHSPSVATMLKEIPEMKIEVDACFLSNPYATDLFIEHLEKDLIQTKKIRDVLEFYPPQNHEVAKSVSSILNISPNNIFVGNGAIEIIQAVMHRFAGKKVCIIIPTFSSYYEFVQPGTEVLYYRLKKDDSYQLDVKDFASFVQKEKPDTVVIINPNNPNGGYIPFTDLQWLLNEISFVRSVILDESFIHFAYEDNEYSYINNQSLIDRYDNIIILKSMSKDFGVAGLRAGYAIMNEKKVKTLLQNGYLWNVSGIADYFFKLYADHNFLKKYHDVRKKYIEHTNVFFEQLTNIEGIKVLPSKANFALIEIVNNKPSFDFCIDMLVNYNVYVRDCSDKIGLDGSYVRIAARSDHENAIILNAIKQSIKL